MTRRKMLPPPRIARPSRPRLSSIDMLPAIAKPAVSRALAQLLGRSLSKEQVLAGLNAELAALDIKPISESAFGRWSIKEERKPTRLVSEEQIAAAGAVFIANAIANSLVDSRDAVSIVALGLAFRSAVASMDAASRSIPGNPD